MMKKYIFAIPLVLWISGCTEVNYAKLSYQVRECLGDYSVRCTDIRIRQSIASTKLFQKKITDEKQRAVAEIGEAGYQQLLSLVEQKIHYLEEQRPHFFWRWFQGDSTYYRDIDYGDQFDIKIEKLINTQNVTSTNAVPVNLVQDGEPIHVASEQNQTDHFSEKYEHSYTFKVINPVLEKDNALFLDTEAGPIKLDMQYTSVAQNFILEKLKQGDCIQFSAKDTPIMNDDHQLYFETYITDPQIVQCVAS
ncbi:MULTISPECIES: hypothetical protein [Acinetobacter calcoaceticus/baumannii complex]|uniref:hypothetical protein n=2 Tax=Acinetobacter calcoaceticus/baumannii complex TaxID=909768 RepID=UPI001EEA031D|nr:MULTISPECIES: hypothetical protein [Acinetobacter calcoaceticus/baumannii complex]MCZ3308778.1 hypothetical protein [Acinetobacter baumannii]MCZ3356412.1 hypothetical protein [Acinetobacter baumannii]MDC4640071.1 hypothetical protein [Acinetobacter baumannii]MDV4242633.1 hypothetical protein [Acinetobacter baumannii]